MGHALHAGLAGGRAHDRRLLRDRVVPRGSRMGCGEPVPHTAAAKAAGAGAAHPHDYPRELNKLKLHGTIRVPMYITQQRRNAMGVGMMMEADLDTTEHSSHWVLQGVALVLNTDA